MRGRVGRIVVAMAALAGAGGALLTAGPSAAFEMPPATIFGEQLISVSGDGRFLLTNQHQAPGRDARLTDRLTGTEVDAGNAFLISDDGSTLLGRDGTWTNRFAGTALAPPIDGVVWPSVSTGRFHLVSTKLMSNDGRFVLLTTAAPTRTWRWDTSTGALALVADDAAGVTISGDGRLVAIERTVPCAIVLSGCASPRLVDMSTGREQSLPSSMSAVSDISDDGRYVLGLLGPIDPNLATLLDIGRLDRATGVVQNLGRWQGDLQMSNDGSVVAALRGHVPAVIVLPDTTIREVGPEIGDFGAFLTGDGSEIVWLNPQGISDDHTQSFYELVVAPVRAGRARLHAEESVPLTVAGRFGVPADATAVALNVTAVGMTGSGFVTVYPCGSTVPLASNLNHETGETVPNAVVAKLDDQGRVCLYTKAGGDLVVDVVGYFPAGTPLDARAPVRLLDTREALGVPTTTPLDAGSVVRVQIAGSAGIAADATTAVLNLTATGAAADGFVTVYPCGGAVPTVSNLNYARGQTVANAVVARLDATGGTCLFTKSSTHLVVDVNGTASGAGALAGIEPLRLLDTRDVGAPVAAGEAVRVRVAGKGTVPADASAAVLNVTATEPTADGFLTVYPCSATPPTASTVNYVRGQTVANLALARLSADGDVCIFTKATTHVIVDVGGAAVGTTGFVAIDPVRALDTRNLA